MPAPNRIGQIAFTNPAPPGVKASFGPEPVDTFRRDLHPDLCADCVLTKPPFNESDTTLLDSGFLQSEAKMQVLSEAKDNLRKNDDVRWQPSEARQIAKGNPQGERGGVHQFGVPPKVNANFAWVQHFIHHLARQSMDGFVLPNGSMSSNKSGEGYIRRALIETDLVDCMAVLDPFQSSMQFSVPPSLN